MKKSIKKNGQTHEMKEAIKVMMKDYLAKQTHGVSAKQPFLLEQVAIFVVTIFIMLFITAYLAFSSSSLEHAWVWFFMPIIFIIPIAYMIYVIVKVNNCQWPFILTLFWPIKLTHLPRLNRRFLLQPIAFTS